MKIIMSKRTSALVARWGCHIAMLGFQQCTKPCWYPRSVTLIALVPLLQPSAQQKRELIFFLMISSATSSLVSQSRLPPPCTKKVSPTASSQELTVLKKLLVPLIQLAVSRQGAVQYRLYRSSMSLLRELMAIMSLLAWEVEQLSPPHMFSRPAVLGPVLLPKQLTKWMNIVSYPPLSTPPQNVRLQTQLLPEKCREHSRCLCMNRLLEATLVCPLALKVWQKPFLVFQPLARSFLVPTTASYMRLAVRVRAVLMVTTTEVVPISAALATAVVVVLTVVRVRLQVNELTVTSVIVLPDTVGVTSKQLKSLSNP